MHTPANVICKRETKRSIVFSCRDANCNSAPIRPFVITHSIRQVQYGKDTLAGGAISIDISVGLPSLFGDGVPTLVYNSLKNFFNISIWTQFDTTTLVGRRDKQVADLGCKNTATYSPTIVSFDENGHYVARLVLPQIEDVFSCKEARNWKP